MAAAIHAIRQKKMEEQRRRKDGVLISLDVQRTFDRYDEDESGDIDKTELKAALEDLGLEVSRGKVKAIMKKYCKKGTDSLDIDTFDVLVNDLKSHMQKEKTVADTSEPFVRHSCFGRNRPLPQQARVRALYMTPLVSWVVAFFIAANFIVNIVEKEIDPDAANLKYEEVWNKLDVVFNIIFLVELVVNMYGYGGPVLAFWKSPWNVFDFLIVAVGVLLISGVVSPESPAGKLKLLRAFRVFRLFKRIKSLNQIIVALVLAIPGVFNAFIVMVIFLAIYAILAVELFRDLCAAELNGASTPS